LLAARGPERLALGWLVGLMAWSTVALAFAAPGLQRIVAGLPNDHYHASLDPVVATLLGISIAPLLARGFAAWRGREARQGLGAGLLGAAALLGIVTLEVVRIPPPDPNGGWAAAQAAGQRVVDRLHGPPTAIVSLPGFKLADGIAFPIFEAARRLPPGSSSTSTGVVIVCDRLLESQIGAACGGPAEDGFMFGNGPAVADPYTGITPDRRSLIDRFDASARTSVSVYLPVVTP
jgi:hypothetical protein